MEMKEEQRMKKLILATILLFAVASANAALRISVDGVVNPPWVLKIMGDTVNIGVFSDGQSPQGTYYMGITFDSQAILDITNAGEKVFWAYDEYAVEHGIQYPYVGMNLFEPFAPPGTPLMGMQVDNIMLCTMSPDVTLLLYDSTFNLLDSQLISTGIPEPATMILLSLGGLMLLRKKR
jgi:hypothetical protein